MTPATEAFVLGAGFSRAISDAMPLTDELGRRLAAADRNVFGSIEGSFEAWLSHRADPQPYLDAVGNLRRQADFAHATKLIARILDDCIDAVLSEPLPDWLGELISVWHLRESQVLTFNYDPLVECAFESLAFHDWRARARFQWGALINYSPRGFAGSSYDELEESGAPHPSLRLWKLHGSTNWYWSPGDATGATARRVRLPGRFGAPRAVDDEEQHWAAPGRERFLVPPAATKSAYYRNPVTREIWSRGYEALREAEVITLMGYSLPQTDLTTSGMLAEAIAVGHAREVRIVDFSPGTVDDRASLAWRVRQLAPRRMEIAVVGDGRRAVPEYVSRLVTDAGRAFARDLRAWRPPEGTDPLVLVDWGDVEIREPIKQTIGRTAAVMSHRGIDGDGTLHLVAEDLRTLDAATWHRTSGAHGIQDELLPLTWTKLAPELDHARRISIAVPGLSREVTAIASAIHERPIGQGGGTWLHLVPAGACGPVCD